ncbi:hypothetical protein [Leptospira stimsonii]|uniref:hypothetical protein n=1 Tax=Leptospira stimsonii TaxID=2202203 RepID=UPI00142FEA86|nr:hypothetical protein [Leptospira stimsonii]
MKQNLIKVYKKLKDGSEVGLLADESQLDSLLAHPDFRIPESKEAQNPKKQIEEKEEQN